MVEGVKDLITRLAVLATGIFLPKMEAVPWPRDKCGGRNITGSA